MSDYEVLMLFSLSKGEEATEALKNKFLELISANGTLGEVEDWGKRKLAYPVNDEPEGYYVLANFKSEPSFPTEFDRVFGITDGALRAMIVNKGGISNA
jgi:small subunit ribosomal protein S6